MNPEDLTCQYSDLPSPLAYLAEQPSPTRSPLTEADIDRIVEMAWEDRTPFEAMQFQFQLTEPEVIDLMRKTLKPNSFRLWRIRVEHRATKHQKKRDTDVTRFKSAGQRHIGGNKSRK